MLDLIPENLGEISSLLRRKGWTKSDIAALEIAGDGNMNRAYRARLVDGTTIILKQSVDHVAKYPSIPAPLERVAVEAAFYATIE